MGLEGKTIEKVMIEGFLRGSPAKPFNYTEEESEGSDVTIHFTDGSRAVLSACSCCGGLGIELVEARRDDAKDN
jgi:hypothetical protein